MADRSGPPSRTRPSVHGSRVVSRRQLLTLLAQVGLVAGSWSEAHADPSVPTIGKPPGRPRIRIDRITLPAGVAGAAEYVRHLERTLRKEARRADWGAGRGSTISFRFVVEELTLSDVRSALSVRCSARGELPRHRAARSKLVYSGDPKQPRELVRRVLTIVARGVVTRLSDLERSRRQR